MTDMTPEELKEVLELAREDVNDWDMRVAAGMTATDKDPAHVRYARALLYYLKPKPIAEADKSKKWLGITERGDMAKVQWNNKYKCWEETREFYSFDPTHFYPLPPAPEGE